MICYNIIYLYFLVYQSFIYFYLIPCLALNFPYAYFYLCILFKLFINCYLFDNDYKYISCKSIQCTYVDAYNLLKIKKIFIFDSIK